MNPAGSHDLKLTRGSHEILEKDGRHSPNRFEWADVILQGPGYFTSLSCALPLPLTPRLPDQQIKGKKLNWVHCKTPISDRFFKQKNCCRQCSTAAPSLTESSAAFKLRVAFWKDLDDCGYWNVVLLVCCVNIREGEKMFWACTQVTPLLALVQHWFGPLKCTGYWRFTAVLWQCASHALAVFISTHKGTVHLAGCRLEGLSPLELP